MDFPARSHCPPFFSSIGTLQKLHMAVEEVWNWFWMYYQSPQITSFCTLLWALKVYNNTEHIAMHFQSLDFENAASLSEPSVPWLRCFCGPPQKKKKKGKERPWHISHLWLRFLATYWEIGSWCLVPKLGKEKWRQMDQTEHWREPWPALCRLRVTYFILSLLSLLVPALCPFLCDPLSCSTRNQ